MLIDDAQHITMLSGPMPGFEYLQGLLLLTWNLLSHISSKFKEKDGKDIWISEDYIEEGSKIKISKYSEGNICLVHNKFEFATNLLASSLKNIIEEHSYKNSKGEAKYYIPEHLREFAILQCDNWAKSAWRAAYSLQENQNYIIINDENGIKQIKSVDLDNTGVVQENMVLSDGLHQFLQIKHSLYVTAENLVTSYVSNVEFFKRFGRSIYGLTGTIGTEESQSLLREVYKIDIGFMPTFKKKQLKELPRIL